jgi:hypothetical protein
MPNSSRSFNAISYCTFNDVHYASRSDEYGIADAQSFSQKIQQVLLGDRDFLVKCNGSLKLDPIDRNDRNVQPSHHFPDKLDQWSEIKADGIPVRHRDVLRRSLRHELLKKSAVDKAASKEQNSNVSMKQRPTTLYHRATPLVLNLLDSRLSVF